MRSLIPNKKQGCGAGRIGATGLIKIALVCGDTPPPAPRGRAPIGDPWTRCRVKDAGQRQPCRIRPSARPRGRSGLPGVAPSRGLRRRANPVAARPNQHNRSARRKRGQRGIYTPFISRAQAALLIAADCVVAGDATLAESGPFLVRRDEATRAADVEPRTAPLGVGLATGAVRLGRTASACRLSPAPLKRSRSRDLWAVKGGY
jgi:hypothetical protein